MHSMYTFASMYIFIHMFYLLISKILLYVYEQPSKLVDAKICIGWKLVFRKCKKLSLAMGPFQIAIPHVEFNS